MMSRDMPWSDWSPCWEGQHLCPWRFCWFGVKQKSSHPVDLAVSPASLLVLRMEKQTWKPISKAPEGSCPGAVASNLTWVQGFCACPSYLGGRKQEMKRTSRCHESIFIIIEKGSVALLSSILWWSKIKREGRAREMITQQTPSNLARVYLSDSTNITLGVR